jgi:hypothetical protein
MNVMKDGLAINASVARRMLDLRPAHPNGPAPAALPEASLLAASTPPNWSAPIVTAIAQVFGVDGRKISSRSRGRAAVALARQVAMYTVHVGCGVNLTDVGRLFSRDRTTVAHACGLVEDRRDDPAFDRALELIELVARALAAHRPGPADQNH